MFPIIKSNTSYYLIKTNNGYYYQSYIDKKIVGLYSLLVSSNNNELITNKKNKLKDLKLFAYELTIGDFVLIPNYRNKLITIGKVTSHYYCDNNRIYRNVKWLKTINISDFTILSKYFYFQYNIVKINDLHYEIDRNIYQYYLKENMYHIIIKVKQQENILCKSLYGLYDLFLSNIDKNKLQIKITVQSPGIIELISDNIDVIITIVKIIKLIRLLTKKEKITNRVIKEKYEEYEIEKLKLECPNFPNNS